MAKMLLICQIATIKKKRYVRKVPYAYMYMKYIYEDQRNVLKMCYSTRLMEFI